MFKVREEKHGVYIEQLIRCAMLECSRLSQLLQLWRNEVTVNAFYNWASEVPEFSVLK